MSYDFLFFADSHLDTHAWGEYPELRGDAMFAFQQIIDLALDYEVPQVICGGDLADARQPVSEVVHFLGRQLDRLHAAGIPFCFIQGQHELAQPPWALATFRGSQHLHQQRLTLTSGRRLYGLDFQYRDALPAALETIPADTDVLIMHQVWEEFMGGVAVCEGALTQVPHASQLFTGDYHRLAVHATQNRQGRPLTVYSPGATHLRKINEPDEYQVFLLDVTGEVYHVPLRSRCALRQELIDEEDFAHFNDNWPQTLAQLSDQAAERQLPESLRKPIVEVVYHLPAIENAYNRLLTLCGTDVFLFPKEVIHEAELPDEEQQAQRIAEDNLVEQGLAGCLALLVPADDPRYTALFRLLQPHNNPRLELQALREERFQASGEQEEDNATAAS